MELLGLAGAVLMTAMSLPQIARILRDHSAAGVSLLTWCIFALSGTSWLAYGILLRAPAVIIGNITFVATVLPVVMLLLMRQRGWATAVGIAVPLLLGALALAGLLSLPAAVSGAFGVLWGVLSTVPQLYTSIRNARAHRRSEVSLATLGLLVCGQGLWLAYGLARSDPPLIATNVIAISVTASLIAVESRQRQRGH